MQSNTFENQKDPIQDDFAEEEFTGGKKKPTAAAVRAGPPVKKENEKFIKPV